MTTIEAIGGKWKMLIPGVSQKVLTQQLKELEPIFDVMYDWGVTHRQRQGKSAKL